jgi:hypothetical protein
LFIEAEVKKLGAKLSGSHLEFLERRETTKKSQTFEIDSSVNSRIGALNEKDEVHSNNKIAHEVEELTSNFVGSGFYREKQTNSKKPYD